MQYEHIETGKVVTAIQFTGKNHTRLELFAGSSRNFHEIKKGDWIVKRGHADYWAVTRKAFETEYERLV